MPPKIRRFTIDVTQEHIDRANSINGEQCMVFLALKPLFPKLSCVGVAHAMFNNDKVMVDLPVRIQSIIVEHFMHIPVKPFSFEWEVPEKLCD